MVAASPLVPSYPPTCYWNANFPPSSFFHFKLWVQSMVYCALLHIVCKNVRNQCNPRYRFTLNWVLRALRHRFLSSRFGDESLCPIS
jgi:hypothetical protein